MIVHFKRSNLSEFLCLGRRELKSRLAPESQTNDKRHQRVNGMPEVFTINRGSEA